MKRRYIFAGVAVLFMALLAMAFFFPEDIDGKVLNQHDIQQGMANGHEAQEYAAQTGHLPRWTNSLFGGMPTFQISPSYASAPWLNAVGKAFGLWLPQPANLLFAMMLGFFIMGMCMQMRWYVSLFGAVAWAFSSYFIIIIGAGHIWKYLTLIYIPPTIGGIWLCYRGKYLAGGALTALFGALQLLSNHVQMSYYFMFVIAAIVGALLVRHLRNHTMKEWWLGSAAVAAAGVLALGANCASLYNTAQYAKETQRGRATYLSTTGKNTAKSGADFDWITQWSYGPDETMTLLVPNAKGGANIKPTGEASRQLTVADIPGADKAGLDADQTAVAQGFPQYFGNQPMTNGPVYIGSFVLVLALLGLCICRGSLRWWLLGVSILAIFLSWGHNFEWLSRLMIDHFPGYSKFRTVSSILVIVEFTLPLLAMMALARMGNVWQCKDGLRKDMPETETKKMLGNLYLISGIALLVCLITALCPSIMGSGMSAAENDMIQEAGVGADPFYLGAFSKIKSLRLGMVSADAWRSLLFIALGTALVALYLRGNYKSPAIMTGGVLLVCLLDLYTVDKRYVDSENFTTPSQATIEPNMADLEILTDTDPDFRVMYVDGFSDSRPSYFHKTIGGYHAAKLTRYNDLLERQITKGNPEVLNMLNTKYFVTLRRNDAGQVMGNELGEPIWDATENPGAMGHAWWVSKVDYVKDSDAEMAALDTLKPRYTAVADGQYRGILGKPKAPAPGDTITLTSYAPDELTYKTHSSKGGVAVFSEIYFPWGWQATIDGKPAEIARVDWTLRALRVPAGDHEVTFRFDPQSLKVTDTVSVACVIVIYSGCLGALLAWLLSLSKRKKD